MQQNKNFFFSVTLIKQTTIKDWGEEQKKNFFYISIVYQEVAAPASYKNKSKKHHFFLV